jgi:hypothetical protein
MDSKRPGRCKRSFAGHVSMQMAETRTAENEAFRSHRANQFGLEIRMLMA